MARLRATPRPRDFQDSRDPAKLLAEKHRPAIRQTVAEALKHFRTLVPVGLMAGAIRRGELRRAAAAVPYGHFAEVLKSVFRKIADLRHEASDMGAQNITAAFRRAGKPVRFRKAFNPDEPRDDRGRWTSGGGSGASSGGHTIEIGGRVVTAELSPVARALGEKMVTIDAGAFDQAFSRDRLYVGRGGSGGMEGRYTGFQDYLANHGSFQVSEVSVQANGRVNFTNGRHRYAVLRDAGLRGIPVSMDRESIRNAKRHGYILSIEKAIGDGFDFDRFDEETMQALRDAQDELIAELSDQTRDTVAYMIDRGVKAGDSADEIAASIRDTISLTERQAHAVANYRNLLEDLDQGALDRALRNADLDEQVQDAIDSGEVLSSDVIDSLVDDYADNYLDYRAQTIAQTESVRASNEGLRDSYRQAADRGAFPAEAVRRFWKLGDRPCPVCMQISESNRDGVGLNEDFQSDNGPVDDSPVHTSCYCTIEYIINLDMLPDASGETEAAA